MIPKDLCPMMREDIMAMMTGTTTHTLVMIPDIITILLQDIVIEEVQLTPRPLIQIMTMSQKDMVTNQKEEMLTKLKEVDIKIDHSEMISEDRLLIT